MSLFVLDGSVAVKWVLPEPGSAKALAFHDDVRNSVDEIIAPDVFASEIAHVLTFVWSIHACFFLRSYLPAFLKKSVSGSVIGY